MSSFFLVRDGDLLGPYQREELVRRLEEGSIAATDLVQAGMEDGPFPVSILSMRSGDDTEDPVQLLRRASAGMTLTERERARLTAEDLIALSSLANQTLSKQERAKLSSEQLVFFARLGNPLTNDEVARLTPRDRESYRAMLTRLRPRDS